MIVASASSRFLATNIPFLPLSARKLAAPVPRGQHRVHHRRPEGPALQRGHPGGRRPPRGHHHVLELGGGLPRLPDHPRRPPQGRGPRGGSPRPPAPGGGGPGGRDPPPPPTPARTAPSASASRKRNA